MEILDKVQILSFHLHIFANAKDSFKNNSMVWPTFSHLV